MFPRLRSLVVMRWGVAEVMAPPSLAHPQCSSPCTSSFPVAGTVLVLLSLLGVLPIGLPILIMKGLAEFSKALSPNGCNGGKVIVCLK